MSVRRSVAGLVAVVVLAGSFLVLAAAPAVSESDEPTGYTTLLHELPGPDACQLAKIDLDAGGAVTPIGPTFKDDTDGCPLDLAIRDKDDDDDSQIFAVVEHSFTANGTSESLLAPAGAVDVDGLAGALAVNDPSVLIKIDPKTGARTTVGSLGFSSYYGALAFDEDGTLWFFAVNTSPSCGPGKGAFPGLTFGQCLFRLDPQTGHAKFVAQGPAFFTSSNEQVFPFLGATASCEDVFANVARGTSNADAISALNRVNTETGALNPRVVNYGPFSQINMTGIESVTDSDKLWGVAVFVLPGAPGGVGWATFRVDPDTGKKTQVANLTVGPDDNLKGLAIPGGLSCDEGPEAVPVTAPPVVVAEPSFTG